MNCNVIGVAALALVAGVGACAASSPPVAPTNGAEQAQLAAQAKELVPLMTLARQALSEHLKVPVKDVQVLSIAPVEWRDSSLGCAKPDRGYMQVITPGHLAVLEHGGREYNVHIAGKRAFVCRPEKAAKGEKVAPIPGLAILSAERIQELARADLAKRLEVPVEDIAVARSNQVEFPDTSLGCPKPEETYPLQRTRGYVLELTHRGRHYTYHSDLRRVIPCPAIERS